MALAFTDIHTSYAGSDWARNGWSPVIIARGEYRAQLKSMPIEARPMRPFHFYGNMVRRIHHLNRVCRERGLIQSRPHSVRWRW